MLVGGQVGELWGRTRFGRNDLGRWIWTCLLKVVVSWGGKGGRGSVDEGAENLPEISHHFLSYINVLNLSRQDKRAFGFL